MKKTIRPLLIACLGIASLTALTACDVKAKEYEKGTPVKVGLICLNNNQSTYDKNFIDGLNSAVADLGDRVDGGKALVKTDIPETRACYNAAKELVNKSFNRKS